MRQTDTNLNVYYTVRFVCKYVVQLSDTAFLPYKKLQILTNIVTSGHEACTLSCMMPKHKDDCAGSDKGPAGSCPRLDSDQ